jgi:hypothetical protein
MIQTPGVDPIKVFDVNSLTLLSKLDQFIIINTFSDFSKMVQLTKNRDYIYAKYVFMRSTPAISCRLHCKSFLLETNTLAYYRRG